MSENTIQFAGKARGRPKGDTALRKLRSMAWYLAVKSKENLNDSQLDRLFGPNDNDGKQRNSADRLKIFEAIRINGSIPSDGTKGRRGFDLVERVNEHPDYVGTAAIIHSPFWTLLTNKSIPLNEIREMVVVCVKNLGLAYEIGYYENESADRNFSHEIEFDNSELTLDNYFQHQIDGDECYDNSMASALNHLEPSLDYIALLGALSFEAIEAGNMIIAASLVRSFKIILKEYCEQEWLSDFGDQLYQLAINRMLAVLNNDTLRGLPSYMSMLTGSDQINLGSPIATLLRKHEHLIWRR